MKVPDLIAFWSDADRMRNWPALTGVALRTLAIPTSEASVERHFSDYRDMLGDRRTRLKQENLRAEAIVSFAGSRHVPLDPAVLTKELAARGATMAAQRREARTRRKAELEEAKTTPAAEEPKLVAAPAPAPAAPPTRPAVKRVTGPLDQAFQRVLKRPRAAAAPPGAVVSVE